MSKQSIWTIIVILVIIIAAVVIFMSDRAEETPQLPAAALNPLPTVITPNHYFADGTHTVEGTMTLPTPCHSLSHEVFIAESFPEQVTIQFTTVPPEEGTVCVQSISEKFYSVEFEASEDADISASLDGKPLELKFSEEFEGIVK